MSGRGSVLETGGIIQIVPIREQFVNGGRFDDIARDDVSAELACFFEKQNSKVFVSGFVSDLLQANGGAEASGSCVALACFRGREYQKAYRHLQCRHRPHRSPGPAAEDQMSRRRLQDFGVEYSRKTLC